MRGCGAHAAAQPGLCTNCAQLAQARSARVRKLAVLGPLGLLTAGGAAFLLTRPTHPPAPPRTGSDDPVQAFQRARLATAPCDAETSMALVDHLIEEARWLDAATFAKASIERCGVIGRMKWRLAYADQQRHDYAETERVTGELITEEPGDSDFWWWRGEARAYAGRSAEALADYRQSLALANGAQAGQFAANRLALPAKAVRATCEADRAWRYYVRGLGGEPTQEMRDEVAATARARTCAAELGTGRETLATHVTVSLSSGAQGDAGALGTLDVDPHLGTTLISRELAAKAGLLVADGPRCQATSRGKLYAGTPVRITLRIGSATARAVEVLVTDDMPGDAGGILGLSFLWHFSFAESGATGGVTLAPPTETRI